MHQGPKKKKNRPVVEEDPFFETGTKTGHISGPRVTWDPKQGSLGPHLACDQIWSAGVSPRTTPKTGKIHFWAFSARFMPWAAAKFLQVPQTPPKPSKWRISRGNRVKPPNVRRQSKKVAQRERGFDEPRNSRKLADGAELRPEQFFLVGSLTNKTGPQLTKRPSAPYLGS